MSSGNHGENDESTSRKRKMKQPLEAGESSQQPRPKPNPNSGAPLFSNLRPSQDQFMASARGININRNPNPNPSSGVPQTPLFSNLIRPRQQEPFMAGFNINPNPNPNPNPGSGIPQSTPLFSNLIRPRQQEPFMASARGININNNVQNNLAPPTTRPFSFVAMLTHMDDLVDPYPDSPYEEIERAIFPYRCNLRQWMENQQRGVKERAVTRLREVEHEFQLKTAQYNNLASLAEFYKNKTEKLQQQVSYHEQLATALRGNIAHQRELLGQVPESSHQGSANNQAVTEGLECRVCKTAAAVMMMLPCRHVSVCKGCDELALTCPICNQRKALSIPIG